MEDGWKEEMLGQIDQGRSLERNRQAVDGDRPDFVGEWWARAGWRDGVN